ncbi:RNA polymerase sigma factor [Saccharothrix variisporea]|uniref:RNA polymerase sigma-70 factor (ECF subfamily) n=1 Tax=Saccharothrix variisporea TaxID=543527 RepID=A0A495XI37_9PSEU|nr:hypothetical protein [Saccharothrix variisporea]RKT72424.1 RNA polymerase sigma-70 factor (ECF subfamily) [Saccharothrix variisporea]
MADTDERRQADVDLRDALVAEDCAGPLWNRFAATLAEYGYAVVIAWIKSGAIFAKCAEQGWSVGEPPPYWDYEDLVGLASDTVVKAIEQFRRKALLSGGWTPDGGASLKSYFANACVLAFPNQYRKWRTEFTRRTTEAARLVSAEQLTETPSTHPAVDDVVISRIEVKRALSGIRDERARTAVFLRDAGYAVGEIAELLDTSHGTVKGVLERLRRNGADSFGTGGGDV